jgi:hypothetical protein
MNSNVLKRGLVALTLLKGEERQEKTDRFALTEGIGARVCGVISQVKLKNQQLSRKVRDTDTDTLETRPLPAI